MTSGPAQEWSSDPTSVLVNLTWLVPGVVGGSERATTDALRAVLECGPNDVDLRLAVLRPFLAAHPDLAAALPCEVLDLDGSAKLRRVVAEQTWLAMVARRTGAQVVHHAGGVVPILHPGRVVVTIHDLQPLDLPSNFSVAKRIYIRTMVGRSARTADVVCVPSGFTRSRVLDLLAVSPSRVRVVPWSVPPHDLDPDPATVPDKSEVHAGASADGPYFLYPAITYPHKNHMVLIEAFARVAATSPDVHLVLTGGEGPVEHEVTDRVRALGLGARVRRTGRVSSVELDRWYEHAAAVVVPSRYEGFGLPALEAMARGCPVIASRAGSLPEFVRAEDLVDPDDVTAWANAMQAVLSMDGSERSARIAAGLARALEFTPERTASALLDSYRQAAGAPVDTPAP